jgi:hypothetical protein
VDLLEQLLDKCVKLGAVLRERHECWHQVGEASACREGVWCARQKRLQDELSCRTATNRARRIIVLKCRRGAYTCSRLQSDTHCACQANVDNCDEIVLSTDRQPCTLTPAAPISDSLFSRTCDVMTASAPPCLAVLCRSNTRRSTSTSMAAACAVPTEPDRGVRTPRVRRRAPQR